MKIAILLLNRGRGSGEVSRQQAYFLAESGHEVVFMHPDVGDGVENCTNLDIKLPSSIVPVHENLPSASGSQKPVSEMTYDEAASYIPAYEEALESVIADVDIVIGHHANISAVATQRVSVRHNKPYVLFLHGTGIEPRHHGGYDSQVWQEIQQAVEQANGIIVTTEYVRDSLIVPLIPLPLERFIVLPCGISTEEFHPDNSGSVSEKYSLPDRFVICPGALTASKGPMNVVAATKQYADLAPTIFIGDGELREELEAELGDRGRFLGFVSREDKAQLINAATVLLAAPEKKEHFGIIYVEALAAGTVPVAYQGGGVASIITEDTGVLTARDPQVLGQTVRKLLEDQSALDRMAQAGRVRAEQCFSYKMLGLHLEQWLSALAA